MSLTHRELHVNERLHKALKVHKNMRLKANPALPRLSAQNTMGCQLKSAPKVMTKAAQPSKVVKEGTEAWEVEDQGVVNKFREFHFNVSAKEVKLAAKALKVKAIPHLPRLRVQNSLRSHLQRSPASNSKASEPLNVVEGDEEQEAEGDEKREAEVWGPFNKLRKGNVHWQGFAKKSFEHINLSTTEVEEPTAVLTPKEVLRMEVIFNKAIEKVASSLGA